MRFQGFMKGLLMIYYLPPKYVLAKIHLSLQKNYSSNHALLLLVEDWKPKHGKGYLVKVPLKDLQNLWTASYATSLLQRYMSMGSIMML